MERERHAPVNTHTVFVKACSLCTWTGLRAGQPAADCHAPRNNKTAATLATHNNSALAPTHRLQCDAHKALALGQHLGKHTDRGRGTKGQPASSHNM